MIIEKRLENHKVTYSFVFQTTKPQLFFIPKEESQMFTSREYNYAPVTFPGYNNNPYKETVDNKPATNDSTLNASWNATDYIGAVTYEVAANLNLNLVDLKIRQLSTDTELPFPTSQYITKITNGLNKFSLPAQFLNEQFTPEDTLDATPQYGEYLVTLTPKYIDTTVLTVGERFQAQPDLLVDADGTSRRRVITVDEEPFKTSLFNFTSYDEQRGRLMGSIVEVYDSADNLKTTKVIAENGFNGLGASGSNPVSLVLTPDNVGFDSLDEIVATGDRLRIYPRECYFNPILIIINYISETEIAEQAYRYLMNDVVRDITTGVYEVYDKNGVKVNVDGTFDGTVIQRYQVQQFGQFELRKKIDNE